MDHLAYIALGGNIEPRAETLLAAARKLGEHDDVEVLRVSQLIETGPVGPPDQGPYLNGAVELKTSLSPAELLSVLHGIEASLGRNREAEERWGPRTCDLDLLLYDDAVIDTDDITVPHPRMHERAFVLAPLVEIAPDTVHPTTGKTAGELLAMLEEK